jgi:hypothetical protein
MDRVEPRHEPDFQDLTFRRIPRWSHPQQDHRFALGVGIFLLVALVYPWYSYKVQAFLLAKDLEAGAQKVARAMNKEVREANAQMAQELHESEAEPLSRRIAAVRVTGISDGNPPLAVVDLGESNLFEAGDTICRQTGLWLQRSVQGSIIRVQRFKSRGTVAPIQELACP